MTDFKHLAEQGLFDARVPRYTSYPTALQFSETVTPANTRGWISGLPENSSISLYLHIPFCRRLCWFCACRTQGTSSASPVQAYLETLKQEIAAAAALLPAGITVEHLHWGGGTPTLLDATMIADLASTLKSAIPLQPSAQFSVEIDPAELDDARLDALAAAGMNRASIGVQDFDPKIQATIGREQSYAITKRAVDGLRDRGITSLNMDILFGLPHQTRESITDSVQKVLSLSPDRVALYGYAHVPWMAKRQKLIPEDALPDSSNRLALFETATELFVWDGYKEIGIDHFAKPDDGLAIAQANGKLRRNFQGYTDDTSDVLIGLGASAISRLPGGFAQNNPSTAGYQAAVRDGKLATTRGHQFKGQDRIRARLIESLMCDFRVDIHALSKETGISTAKLHELCQPMVTAFPDYVRKNDFGISIMPAGRPLARIIVQKLDAYAAPEKNHSRAI